MTWADYAILAILGISAAVSIIRGFIREALSLLGWVVAFWVSITFAEPVSGLLEAHVSVPSVRLGIAALALFVAVLVVTALAVWLVGLLVESTGLSPTDRLLGMVFGVARGALIVGLLVLLAGLTALPRDPWWQRSQLIPHFEHIALEIRALLPAELAEHLHYDPGPG